MKTFKITYSSLIIGGMCLLLTIGLASVIVNILILASVGPFLNATPAVTIVSLVCSLVLLSIALLMLFHSVYRFGDTALSIIFGFLPMSIPYSALVEIKEHSETHEMFIVFRDTKSEVPDTFNVLRVNIKPEQNESFTASVREHNPEVLYTAFTPESK